MSDIVERIRALRYVHVPVASQLFEEAADEIERLRLAIRRLAEQDATLSIVGGNVIVEMDCQDLSQKNFTLTDEEREAVACGLGEIEGVYPETAATLRSLLERLK